MARYVRYPIQPRRVRIWLKWTSRRCIAVVVTAVIGDPAKPLALVLSSPATGGRVRTAGVTTVLAGHVAQDIGRLFYPTDGPRCTIPRFAASAK
jgi:hypothetical protein